MSETKRVMGCHYKKVLMLSVTTWMMEEKPLNPTSESADEQKFDEKKPVVALLSESKKTS